MTFLTFGTAAVNLLTVVKSGMRQHMKMFEEGVLDMDTLTYFAELENDLLRTGSHEDTSELLSGDGAIPRMR